MGVVIVCRLCDRTLPGTTISGWRAHYLNVHQGVTGDRTPDQWERAAEHLIRHAADTGHEFTIADVLAPLGAHPTPGRRQFVNGQIANRLAAEGVIVHADVQQSTKPSTRRSLVYRWVGKPRQEHAA